MVYGLVYLSKTMLQGELIIKHAIYLRPHHLKKPQLKPHGRTYPPSAYKEHRGWTYLRLGKGYTIIY